MIKVGDKVPEVQFITMTEDGAQKISAADLFKGHKVVLFGVPGAFTPTCSMNHLPGFVKEANAIKAKGVDTIACVAVNDVHVMNAWGKSAEASGKVLMLADGNADFAKATGLDVDLSSFGMGSRINRFSAIIEDGVVKVLHVEDKPGLSVSGADTILKDLERD